MAPRITRPLLAATLTALVLGGCARTDDEPAPDPYLVTDLAGGGTAPVDATSTPSPTSQPTSEPTSTRSPADDVPTGESLVQRIGAAVGTDGTVQVTAGLTDADPVLDALHRYGADGEDLDVPGGSWSPFLELRAVLLGATDLRLEGPEDLDGVAVTSYAFTLDLAEVPRPSPAVPDDVAGDAEVVLSLDGDDRPVRVSYTLPDGVTSSVDYRDWSVAEAP